MVYWRIKIMAGIFDRENMKIKWGYRRRDSDSWWWVLKMVGREQFWQIIVNKVCVFCVWSEGGKLKVLKVGVGIGKCWTVGQRGSFSVGTNSMVRLTYKNISRDTSQGKWENVRVEVVGRELLWQNGVDQCVYQWGGGGGRWPGKSWLKLKVMPHGDKFSDVVQIFS